MTDLSDSCRRLIVEEALRMETEKAHYAKTGYGHKFDPGGSPMGGPPLRAGTVAFIGSRGPTGNWVSQVRQGDRPAMRMVRFAVTSVLGGHRYVCAGRCAEPPLPEADPGNSDHLAHPTLYSWRRPDSRPRAPIRVLRGECCAKRRHFDCLGFVTWCLWKALGADFPGCLTHFSVRRYQQFAEPHPRSGPLLTGDLLFDTTLQHVGIVVSPTEVCHSAGYRWGVRRTSINGNIYPASPGSAAGGAWLPQAGRLTEEIVERLRRMPS